MNRRAPFILKERGRRHSIQVEKVRRDARRPSRSRSPTALWRLDEYKYFPCRGHFLLKAFLASDPRADRHEGAEGAAALHHPFGDLRHQLAAPEAYPPGGEAPEEKAGGHTHAHPHDEAELDAVEAGGPLGSSGSGSGSHGHGELLKCVSEARKTTL